MDDESSSGEVDEGHRAVAVDDVVGEEARCTNGWADGMGVGNHDLGTRLSKM